MFFLKIFRKKIIFIKLHLFIYLISEDFCLLLDFLNYIVSIIKMIKKMRNDIHKTNSIFHF